MKRLPLILAVGLAMGLFAASSIATQGETVIRIDVENRGSIHIKLHRKEAPKTTAHILGLVRSGFYDGQRFFRVLKSPRPYLVQTGDPLSRDLSKLDDPKMGTGGSGAKVPFEDSGFPNEEGAVGLSTPPKERDNGDSQFYMLLGSARFLDGNYTVFGKVIAGMDVLKKIERGDKITSVRVQTGGEEANVFVQALRRR